jgi:hypothetical protein
LADKDKGCPALVRKSLDLNPRGIKLYFEPLPQTAAERVESGMVFVNHPTWTATNLPFGGITNSGYGRELELGFGEFVNRRLVSVSPVGAPPPGVNQGG